MFLKWLICTPRFAEKALEFSVRPCDTPSYCHCTASKVMGPADLAANGNRTDGIRSRWRLSTNFGPQYHSSSRNTYQVLPLLAILLGPRYDTSSLAGFSPSSLLRTASPKTRLSYFYFALVFPAPRLWLSSFVPPLSARPIAALGGVRRAVDQWLLAQPLIRASSGDRACRGANRCSEAQKSVSGQTLKFPQSRQP